MRRFLLIWKGTKKVAERSYPPDFQISSFYNIKKPMFCACYFHRTSVFLISFPYNTFDKKFSQARVLRICEEFLRRILLLNISLVDKDDAGCHLRAKPIS